ncbi:hypothetical protein CFK37_19810 [Virgibacillus phasianinus]|uniref:Uncharacterized protein n=1 Tax=Virgibacillus phasianinus TaxID=2017483 RepID=A0A220U8E8_9BACI|nr:DUF6516 family protein [Virgibacillus phasianinus]ASK64232.1 hypothetical protein CFK37_19810 [Virgibacillus phasianinus]
MRNKNHVQTPLRPAKIPDILKKYGHLLTSHENVPGKDRIYPNLKKTNNVLSVLFPLEEHPVHGKTGLLATEKYIDGIVSKYSYQWKIIIPKLGKLNHHISAWGNDPHNATWTRPEYRVESEPHHHHHVSGDWKARKENWDVWTLNEAYWNNRGILNIIK